MNLSQEQILQNAKGIPNVGAIVAALEFLEYQWFYQCVSNKRKRSTVLEFRATGNRCHVNQCLRRIFKLRLSGIRHDTETLMQMKQTKWCTGKRYGSSFTNMIYTYKHTMWGGGYIVATTLFLC